MYLGQERWARAPTWGGAQQGSSQGSPGQYARQQPPQQQHQQVKEIGDATLITVSGCNHGVVGPIVSGNFTLTTLNHGKPAYRKEQQMGKPDVMLYFWDERDGAGSSGWWLSPKIGSEVVWGFHPNRAAQTPPTTGWKVPYDGGVDPNFLISARRGGAGQQQQQAAAMQGQKGGGKGGIRLNGAAEAKRLEQQAHMEEIRRQQADENKRRVEEQRKRMEEVRRQQEEAVKKQKEQQQKRLEDMRKQQEQAREERRAVAAIRQVFQKFRAVKVDDFDTLEAELVIILDKELDNCGSQKAALKEESTKTLEQAKQRVQVLQDQKKRMEEKRVEEERKRKEAQELAEKLLLELEDLVDTAEAAAEAVKTVAEKFQANAKLKTVDDVAKASRAVAEAEADAQKKAQAAVDHVTSHRQELAVSMKAGAVPAKAAEQAKENKEDKEEEKPSLAKLQARLTQCKSETTKVLTAYSLDKDKKEKKIVAQSAIDQGQASFKKYDKDKDGVLNKKEIEQYAKGECGFTLPSESIDLIFEVLVKTGAKGVSGKDVQRLKVMVGCARERGRDMKRAEDRVAREKELAESKAELQEQIKELVSIVDEADSALKKLEDLVKSAPAESKVQEAIDHVGEVEEALKPAKDLVASTQEKSKALLSLESPEHRPFVRGEVRRLERRTGGFEGRISKVSAWLKKARGEAKKSAAKELESARQHALKVLWAYQQRQKLRSDALFGEFGAKGADGISEEAFLVFFSRCEEKRKEAEKEEKDEKKEEKEQKEGEEQPESPSEDKLKRLFAHLCEEGQDHVTSESFHRFARRYMKVVKDTVITSGINIKEKMVRRLEVKEVVEIIEGPVKEESVGVMRMNAKAMSDGAVGWITVAGNQSTVYLEDGGGVFKVVKETILTDDFELSSPKEGTRKLMTRKLVPNELVEVYEWPKLEEASGLTRMKCRAKSDGAIGWVTTVGNKGAVFVEVA